jgi:hypothetical protein
VQLDVFVLIQVVRNGVMDQAAEKSNVRTGTQRNVKVCDRGRAVEAWIDNDDFCLSRSPGFHSETETDGMVLRWVPSHYKNHVGIGDIRPAVRHSPAAERGGQTGHRGAVSKTGLVFVSENAKPESELAKQVVHFVSVGAAADQRGVGETIYRAAL